jgi:Spy/CpxP family protein refolding chaperone
MQFVRTLSVGFPLALGLVLGCNNASTESNPAISAASAPIAQAAASSSASATASAPAASAVPSASASAEPSRHEHGHRGGGPAGMLLHAASEIDLKPAQQATVSSLSNQLHDETGPSSDFTAYHAALIAGVRAGKIDAVKLAPLQAALEKDMAAHHEKEAAALNGLHAVLEASQRKALVAAVRAKQAAYEAHHKTPQAEPLKPGEGAKRRLEHMTKELDLDAAQQKTVEALLAKDEAGKPGTMDAHRAEMKKQMDALLVAFEGESFDPKKLDLGPAPGKKGNDPLVQRAQFLSVLVPLLKPEQREKLAATLEKPRPEHGGNGELGPATCDGPSCDDLPPKP